VIRTRVGYAGGTGRHPTYHNLDGHAETVQIDFDPSRISYADLLDIFWHTHNPETRPWSWQYASIIFYHDADQQRLAEETKFHHEETHRKVKLYTEIIHYNDFFLAEDYHQKYWLQQNVNVLNEYSAMYPDFAGIVNSTSAARVNGILGGYGTFDGTAEELSSYGLSSQTNKFLIDTIRQWGGGNKLERVIA
jgi:peptide-methionine (S)-S-oxide reductase